MGPLVVMDLVAFFHAIGYNVENDEYLVNPKLRLENQDHVLLVPATTAVRLLSRYVY
jgi:hypothetical protein